MKLLFISIDTKVIDALSEVFKDISNIKCIVGNILDLEYESETMFMSPANSLGFLDGGLDAAYMKMFPDIQKKVQDKIRTLGKTTALGRYYLPIGSAIVVPVQNNCTLVSAPTMFLPHDVSLTNNAYHAMMATFMAFHKYGKCKYLIATGLCCGYGKMDPVVSAKQIRQAYDDFLNGIVSEQIEYISDPTIVLTRNLDHEQPLNYNNREIHELI